MMTLGHILGNNCTVFFPLNKFSSTEVLFNTSFLPQLAFYAMSDHFQISAINVANIILVQIETIGKTAKVRSK